MKVPKPSFILHSLVNKGPLPQLTAEETECTLKCAELSANTSASTDLTHSSSAYPSTYILEPQSQFTSAPGDKACPPSPCFKVPTCKEFPDVSLRASVQTTPRLLPKLVNLSFSQPNSPRTPCARVKPQRRLATPAHALNFFRHSHLDQSVLNTPCVMGALEELQLAQDIGLPDMLALIEDDLTELGQVERQLLRNTDVELTDSNVVDYLLDVAHDHTAGVAYCPHDQLQLQHQPPQPDCCSRSDDDRGAPCKPQQRSASQPPAGPTRRSWAEEQSELNVRRKRRRRGQKRMTAEEALAVRRQRNSRAARAARGRQLLQVSAAAEPEPEPETSGSSVQVSPGVRRSKRCRRQSSRFEIQW